MVGRDPKLADLLAPSIQVPQSLCPGVLRPLSRCLAGPMLTLHCATLRRSLGPASQCTGKGPFEGWLGPCADNTVCWLRWAHRCAEPCRNAQAWASLRSSRHWSTVQPR